MERGQAVANTPRVREYQPGDWPALRAMHQAQGFDYAFPELNDPIFLSKLVVEAEGQVVMASLLRLTAEVYLLDDPRAGTPRQRWQWLLALHRAAAEDAYDRGLADAHCWLPPKIVRSFGRRLFRLGWEEQLWPSFSKKL